MNGRGCFFPYKDSSHYCPDMYLRSYLSLKWAIHQLPTYLPPYFPTAALTASTSSSTGKISGTGPTGVIENGLICL